MAAHQRPTWYIMSTMAHDGSPWPTMVRHGPPWPLVGHNGRHGPPWPMADHDGGLGPKLPPSRCQHGGRAARTHFMGL